MRIILHGWPLTMLCAMQTLSIKTFFFTILKRVINSFLFHGTMMMPVRNINYQNGNWVLVDIGISHFIENSYL